MARGRIIPVEHKPMRKLWPSQIVSASVFSTKRYLPPAGIISATFLTPQPSFEDRNYPYIFLREAQNLNSVTTGISALIFPILASARRREWTVAFLKRRQQGF
jgi:hypothetical protein